MGDRTVECVHEKLNLRRTECMNEKHGLTMCAGSCVLVVGLKGAHYSIIAVPLKHLLACISRPTEEPQTQERDVTAGAFGQSRGLSFACLFMLLNLSAS